MQNLQAQEAGKQADEIIKKLANPSETIETDKTEVEVIDKAKEVEHPSAQPDKDPVAQDDYETRFKRYKASTDKTIYDLRQEVKRLSDIEAERDALKNKLDDVQAQIPSTPNEMLEMFSKEEVDAFDKMLDGKVSGLQSEVERLNKELEEARKKQAEEEELNDHQAVIAAVANAVPNYEQINTDPKFAEFMQDLDEFGNVRFDMMLRAKNSNPPDIGRIIQFFTDFANSNAAQEEPADKRQTYTQQELLQTPNSNSSDTPATPQGLGIAWNQALISELYKDKATGKISASQFKELEADMRRAMGYEN